MDARGDSRGFGLLDFNRDGQIDIALSNANAPLLQLFENQIESGNNFVALKFVGGAMSAVSSKFSARDGYGAVVTLIMGDGLTIKREFRCGEGFAGQNSDTLIIGTGSGEAISKIAVKWPSGIGYEVSDIDVGCQVTFLENSENGPAHLVDEYRTR